MMTMLIVFYFLFLLGFTLKLMFMFSAFIKKSRNEDSPQEMILIFEFASNKMLKKK